MGGRVRHGMAELRTELKRSLGLIGQIDNKASQMTGKLDTLLESIQNNGSNDQTARAVSQIVESILFLRSNSVAEAEYIDQTVEHIRNQIELEIVKLRDPAFRYAIPLDEPQQKSGKKKVVLTFNASEEEPRYCLCDDISYGEMIACDDPKCEIEWYHLACVGLQHAPKTGKWFCPACRKKRQRR